jgi:hypothetical protein
VFPRYLAVNGDEGEPSTFKDHMLVEGDPHQIIEGVIITSFAIQCHHAFIYLRGEFGLGAERLGQAIADAYDKGFIGKNILGSGFDLEVVLHRGAGCYIAGDETGLLSSLEGERAMPRIKPPFPAVQGVYAAPTIVNNVETMSTVPHIINRGGEWYASMGVNRSTARASSRCRATWNAPGNYEIELGMTFRELIYDLAGGSRVARASASSSPWRRVRTVAARGAPRRSRSTWTRSRASSRPCSGRGRSWCSTDTVDYLLVAWRIAKFFATSRVASARRVVKARGGSKRCSTGCRTATAAPRTWTCCSDRQQPRAPPGLFVAAGHDDDSASSDRASCRPRRVCRNYWYDEIKARMARDTEARGRTAGPFGPRSRPRWGWAREHRCGPHEQWPSEQRYVIPVAPGPDVVTVTIDGKEVQAPRGELLIKVAQETRHLHPALLLARAHEAGGHVPHVPGRGRGHARDADLVRHAGHRRHGRHYRSRRA